MPPTRPHLVIRNPAGLAFSAVLIRRQDTYGVDNQLVHDLDEPLIEFYDRRYMHTDYGQFISRYYVSTLADSGPLSSGVLLDIGSPDWRISAQNVHDALCTLAPEALETPLIFPAASRPTAS